MNEKESRGMGRVTFQHSDKNSTQETPCDWHYGNVLILDLTLENNVKVEEFLFLKKRTMMLI